MEWLISLASGALGGKLGGAVGGTALMAVVGLLKKMFGGGGSAPKQ
ncbi:MAG: hypothetical protein MUC36_11275 [Planctomycetes bacterium]|jgi:hypothetical protein|nr:hypothetical protein [Planctomycetota bacterium]